MVLGVGLEVLVVRRDDAEGPLIIEAVQQRLSDGAAYGGLGAAAEFVNQQQARTVGVAHEVLHVPQVRAIGAEVVIYALLVADVDVEPLEDPCLGVILHGDGQSALQEVLQQAHGLEADRLPPSVGPRDEQDARIGGLERDV